jgi:hypothetical protein
MEVETCVGTTQGGKECRNAAKFGVYCGVHKPKGVEIKPTGPAITITFGDGAVNRDGMQKLGKPASSGFSFADLTSAKQFFEERGCECEIHNLGVGLGDAYPEHAPAYVFVAKNGISAILADIEKTAEDCLQEQLNLPWDKQVKMYGKVVNSLARYNLCYDEEAQVADVVRGKGTIIAFKDVPCVNYIRSKLTAMIPKAKNLVAEGNCYYDASKCGVAFHGDSERVMVVALRLGEAIPLHYHWFDNGKPVGERVILTIGSGDLYIMSEKAVGTDWKKGGLTLRHAAGAKKYLEL